jgi:hypothetical protein
LTIPFVRSRGPLEHVFALEDEEPERHTAKSFRHMEPALLVLEAVVGPAERHDVVARVVSAGLHRDDVRRVDSGVGRASSACLTGQPLDLVEDASVCDPATHQ